MKRMVTTVALVVFGSVLASAQEWRARDVNLTLTPPGGWNAQEAGVLGDVVKDAAFTAQQTEDFKQTLGDGTHITRSSTATYARDSQGRVRREDDELIQIFDPVAGVSYRLEKRGHVGSKTPLLSLGQRAGDGVVSVITSNGTGYNYTVRLDEAGQVQRQAQEALAGLARDVEARTVGGPGGRGTGAPRAVEPGASTESHESLGSQMVNGVLADGTRVTNVIPQGAIGNDRPLKTSTERWYSNELHIMVLMKRSDPREGDTVSQYTNIARGEPNAALFQVPAGYTIRDGRR